MIAWLLISNVFVPNYINLTLNDVVYVKYSVKIMYAFPSLLNDYIKIILISAFQITLTVQRNMLTVRFVFLAL